jgi:hypothetical protein
MDREGDRGYERARNTCRQLTFQNIYIPMELDNQQQRKFDQDVFSLTEFGHVETL